MHGSKRKIFLHTMDSFKFKRYTAKNGSSVIIGYSFPTFNRETDKAILDNLKLIQKIYLQVPSIKTFEEIKTKILSLNNNLVHDSIKYVKAGNEFFVPFEFN